MKCVIPQISWNSGQQVLSLDFDPSCKGENGFYRLVTVGADTNVLIWHLSNPDSTKPTLKNVSELNRHQKAVNVARFSPDGNYIASGDDDAYIILWRNDRQAPDEENWTVEKSLRKHLGDVTDLSWSLDANFLLSCSVDNTAVCWDVKKGSSKFLWTDHSGFVQGVSFDPCGELAATISNDRVLRVFDASTGKLKTRVNKYNRWVEKSAENEENVPVVTVTECNESVNEEGEKAKKPTCSLGNHIFLGDDIATFCRRLCFSPRGEFLLVPTGTLPIEKKSVPPLPDPSDSPSDPKKRVKPRTLFEKPVESNNAVIMFCKNDLSVPCAIIPTGTSYSVACRFNPVYYHREGCSYKYGDNIMNPVRADERRIYCTGKLDFESENDEESLLKKPYRIIYAVATNNTVMVGSTDRVEPLAVVRNIHLTRLTDLAWSPDGRVLVTSSTDAYCSVITFDENELGVPYKDEIPPLLPSDFPVPFKVKVKEAKPRASTAKKEKTPAAKKDKTPGGKKEKTPGVKKDKTKEKTPGTEKRTAGKKLKTPKSESTATPDRPNSEKNKIKPIKLLLEAQSAAEEEKAKQKQEDLTLTKDDGLNVEPMTIELPNPYVHLVRLPEEKTIQLLKAPDTPEKEEPSDFEKSPAPIKLMPQKNTLDAWVIKKKVPASTPKREKAKSPDIQILSPPKKQCFEHSEQLSSKNPPSSSASPSSAATIPMEVETIIPAKEVVRTESTIPKVTLTVPPTNFTAENSQSPKQAQKQPRRVQLITLSSSLSSPLPPADNATFQNDKPEN